MSSPRKRLSPDATLCVMRTRKIAIEFHFILDSAPHRLLQLRRDVEWKSNFYRLLMDRELRRTSKSNGSRFCLIRRLNDCANLESLQRETPKKANRFRLQPVSGFTLNLLPTMIKFSCWRIGFLIKSRKKGRDQQKSSVISQFPLKAESFGSIWNRTRLIN